MVVRLWSCGGEVRRAVVKLGVVARLGGSGEVRSGGEVRRVVVRLGD